MDRNKIERLARRMCEMAGHDADARVTPYALYQTQTPFGLVYHLPPDTKPLWECYAHAAQQALDAVDEMPQLVQATYYKDVVRVALALSSRSTAIRSRNWCSEHDSSGPLFCIKPADPIKAPPKDKP